MKPQFSSHRRGIFSKRPNSTRRFALISLIVFAVSVVVGYTVTGAAPSLLHKVVNVVRERKASPPSSQAQRAAPSRLVLHRNRDLNQPLFAHSLRQMLEATVTTDKPDYRPGETAIITGSGFWPNEIVTVQVVHIDGGEEEGAGHEPWNVAADGNGAFTTSWFVNPDDSLGATFLLTAVGNGSGLTAQTTFTDKPGAELEQCANGGVGDPAVPCVGSAWQHGNLNHNQAHYLEGQTVPYRAVLTDLTAGATYTTTIEYDTTQGGDHATDYLMSFNATEVTADPCTGVAGVPSCAPSTFPIPLDPNVSGAGVTQTGGQNFTIYNGTITGVSAYTLTGSYAGSSQTSIVVTFTATANGTAVLAWGGHISTRLDWGVANSAIAISGSPYHMRLIGFTCSNVANCSVGNQDRSLSASAIFFPATLTITKVTVPSPQTTAKLFAFTGTGTDVSNFSLDDDPNTATSNTKSFNLTDTSSRTITEGDPSPGFTFTDLMCNQVPDPQLNQSGTVNISLGTRAVTVTPAEGETISCTYVNTQAGKIIVEKATDPDGDAQSFAFTASYDADGFSLSDGQQNDSGFLSPGTYSVSETVPTGWDLTSSPCVSSKGDNETIGNISLQAGEIVTCTFNNQKDAKIIVKKETDPNSDPQSFAFTASYNANGFSLSDGQQNDSGDLDPGPYSVSETVPAGWDLSSSPCVSSKGDTETIGNISLQAGETVTCTFNNTKRGHIIVDKVTNPSGDTQSFNFDAGGGSYADFSLTDAATPNDQTLTPGNYSVSETVPAGWDLTSSTCVSSINDTEAPGALELDAGETITCTFTNTKRGHIVVDKVTNPTGDTQSFNFDAGGTGYVDFSLTDAATPNDQTLVPGNYSVGETVPTGWNLTSSTCVSSINDTEAPGALELDAGETITCTFTNTKRGHIIVDKVTNPSGDTQSFNFDAGGTGYVDFSLTDAATPNDQSLAPGNYSVSETVPAGWDLTSGTCVSSIDDTEAPGALELDAGETITCTFTNTKRGHIIVDKVTNPSGDTQSFSFDAGGGSYADFSLTDAATPNDQTLVPGNYSVSESLPAGWDLTSSPCVSSINDTETAAAIELDAGETVSCTFNNRKRARLIVEKQTIPDGATGSFTFTGTAAGTISDGGNLPVGNLVPGNYTSTENDPTPNFDLTSIVCNDLNSTGDVASRTATFRLEPGETVKCTFTNTQRGMGQVIKTVNNSPPGGTQAFTFQLRQGATIINNGTTLESLVANAGNGGTLNFTTKLVPGQTYQMCEIIMPGWLSTLGTFVPTSFMPPDGVAVNPNVDNSIVCGDFTVSAGETKVFTIDNTPPPGGRALTIGFWKNWSGACTGGGQKDVLGTTLAGFPIASGQTTHGVFIGKLYVDQTCTEAVPLLDKREVGTNGKKQASDPAYNLAAQLLAAKLNVQAGAGTCGPVLTAINQAQALLYSINFTGVGSYLKKMNPTQAALANCLATWLDDYNNNRASACNASRTCP